VENRIVKTPLPDIAVDPAIRDMIRRALEEDIASGDTTTLALVPGEAVVDAHILAKESCVVSGCGIASAVFKSLDANVDVSEAITDGGRAEPGETILTIHGRAQTVLTGERTALNFMQRMTGIASMTATFVERVSDYGCSILDTRKTTPGLRSIEKYAVLCGGGTNHRIGLFDKVMIKDNHRRLWRDGGDGDLAEAVRAARRCYPSLEIEIEVESEAELRNALEGDPEWILLDNMSPELMAKCVAITAGRSKLEASGGITLSNVEAAARSGVDAISLGCLTHSAPSIDLSLEISE
jgi:nicotinate-nucleotide pyrophosphorylase (carboxylating)